MRGGKLAFDESDLFIPNVTISKSENAKQQWISPVNFLNGHISTLWELLLRSQKGSRNDMEGPAQRMIFLPSRTLCARHDFGLKPLARSSTMLESVRATPP